MTHPLVPKLHRLAALLEKYPSLSTSTSVVKALDRVSKDLESAMELLETAALGDSPEVAELRHLLVQAFDGKETNKEVKKIVKDVLGAVPSKKQRVAFATYLNTVAQTLVKQDKAVEAKGALRRYLDRPTFDTNAQDTYTLLTQIRKLGSMDEAQRKAARAHLLSHPETIQRLCEAAKIPTTTGKTKKAIASTTLVKKLIDHGIRYAENAGI